MNSPLLGRVPDVPEGELQHLITKAPKQHRGREEHGGGGYVAVVRHICPATTSKEFAWPIPGGASANRRCDRERRGPATRTHQSLEGGKVAVPGPEGLTGAPVVAAHGPEGPDGRIRLRGRNDRKGRHCMAHTCTRGEGGSSRSSRVPQGVFVRTARRPEKVKGGGGWMEAHYSPADAFASSENWNTGIGEGRPEMPGSLSRRTMSLRYWVISDVVMLSACRGRSGSQDDMGGNQHVRGGRGRLNTLQRKGGGSQGGLGWRLNDLGDDGDDGSQGRESRDELEVDGLKAVGGDKVEADVHAGVVGLCVQAPVLRLHGKEALAAALDVADDGLDRVADVEVVSVAWRRRGRGRDRELSGRGNRRGVRGGGQGGTVPGVSWTV